MNRRTFLKIASIGSVSFAAGCSGKPEDFSALSSNLFTMVHATEDMIVGEPTWYASTCRECPAGCGVLAKNREGRVIKLEGNPFHPVNQGTICMRGQAGLQALYNPDRLWNPQMRTKDGFKEITFEMAEDLIREKLQDAAKRGPDRIALFTETVGNTQLQLFKTVLDHFGSGPPMVFEPFAYEALKFAHKELFGHPMLPVLHMDQADVLIGFGADFIETWLSPVEYARKFKAMHAWADGQKGLFIQISPFESLTGINSDRWIGCRPGSEAAVILGLIRAALDAGKGSPLDEAIRTGLAEASKDYSPERVESLSGVKIEDQRLISQRLISAKRPLILGKGVCSEAGPGAAVELAALFLNLVLDPQLSLFDFENRHQVETASARADVLKAFDKMVRTPVELVILNNVNPVFAIPESRGIVDILTDPARFVVAFSNFLDETSDTADLIWPVQLGLETWDAYESNTSTLSILQPAMGKITHAPALGDVMLNLMPPEKRPSQNYQALIAKTVLSGQQPQTPTQWLKTVQRGGLFKDKNPASNPPKPEIKAAATLKRLIDALPEPSTDQHLVVPPSIRFFDGRGANRPWLLEIPETISQVAWLTPAFIHPETMAAKGITDGNVVTLKTPNGVIESQAYAYAGLFPGTVAVPLGQGHQSLGRWATGRSVNPVAVLDPNVDKDTGAPSYISKLIDIQKVNQGGSLPITSGSRVAYDRKIALSVENDDIGNKHGPMEAGLTMNTFPLTLPLPEGYSPERDFYPPHEHDGYRWAMVVDMDRCIGCTACVAGCYAENNVGVVGEQRIAAGREMAWLQIQRYHTPADMTRITLLPMMCQHCDNAPCESVCPVYAPHHNKEGLNNQIYNRCIGTRFCAQNCPYKVRRFNWFGWTWPKPLNMQLNPNVTVRSKGVMEKCSFCVQRIKAAHNTAKNENRPIRDGEVVPACVQTCPTRVFTFGNLMDPDSRVRKMVTDPRAYQVMGYLNTKPAVIYLKKVTQSL
jgi:anaerobic selenocysteine-containing dehydrogenase/Fe-S-cluster-containing dehydrogenase component